MPATTLSTDGQILVAFGGRERVIEQNRSTAASKAASTRMISRTGGRQSMPESRSRRHSRPPRPPPGDDPRSSLHVRSDLVAFEALHDILRGCRDAAYPSFDHFLASTQVLELVQ